jgi:hypothetical protein
MDHNAKIRWIAEILVGKHGSRAPSVARRRAKDRLDHQDYATALVWVQVTEVASRLIVRPTRETSEASQARQ